MKKIILAILFFVIFSVKSFAAPGAALNINITSMTLTTAGTEYSFQFPNTTQQITFNGINPQSTDEVGTIPGQTLSGTAFNFSVTPTTLQNMYTYGNQTLYFNSNKNNERIQIIYTTQ